MCQKLTIKQFFVTIFLFGTVSGSAFSQAPPPPSPLQGPPAPPPPPLIYSPPTSSEIADFTPESKLFSARFPGKPSERRQNVNDAVVITYRVYRKGSNSVVGITETTMLLANRTEDAFRQIKESIEQHGGKIEKESEAVTSGWKGKEFGFQQDLSYRRLRVFIVGARIFEIQSDVTNWHIIGDKVKAEWNKETDWFFESFKIR